MSDVKWNVVDRNGTTLFHINYVPPIGSTLHYFVEWEMLRGKEFADHVVNHWRSIDKKYWTVVDVYCEVRNYGGDEVPVYFVDVVEKEGEHEQS